MQVVDANLVRSRFSLGGHPQVVEMLCPHCLRDVTFNIRRWTEHAGRIAQWRAQGKDVFVYFNNDGRAAAVGNARRLIELTAAQPVGRRVA